MSSATRTTYFVVYQVRDKWGAFLIYVEAQSIKIIRNLIVLKTRLLDTTVPQWFRFSRSAKAAKKPQHS